MQQLLYCLYTQLYTSYMACPTHLLTMLLMSYRPTTVRLMLVDPDTTPATLYKPQLAPCDKFSVTVVILQAQISSFALHVEIAYCHCKILCRILKHGKNMSTNTNKQDSSRPATSSTDTCA